MDLIKFMNVKNFRNEGMDRNHNPEFTALEFYQAYADVYEMMDITELILKAVSRQLDNTVLSFSGHKINIDQPFKRETMFGLLNKATGKNVDELDEMGLSTLAKDFSISVEDNLNYGQLLDKIFGELVEPNLIQPTFVTDYPKAISPLAKENRNGKY